MIALPSQDQDQKQRIFEDVNLLECKIIQQVKEAIDANFLESEIYIDTWLVKGKISKIMMSLFPLYGANMLTEVKQEGSMVN